MYMNVDVKMGAGVEVGKTGIKVVVGVVAEALHAHRPRIRIIEISRLS